MKRTRNLIALLLVLIMTIGMPLSALAASHDVSTADDVLGAVATDTDAEVTLNMKNDIDMGHNAISGNEGQTYTINGNGNAIANVGIASGDVTVNADMEGSNDFFGDSNVTVNGDVEQVYASGDTVVNINGDVTGIDGTEDAPYGEAGIYAGENAQVTVDGDVSGGDGFGQYNRGGDGVEASDDAVVHVTGDVTGGNGTLTEEEMLVVDSYCDGGTGVDAYGNAQVTVDGNVTGGDAMGSFGYAGAGVYAEDEAVVTVGGDVAGGDVTVDPNAPVDDEEYEYVNSMGGTAVYMDSTATVTVEGNAIGGTTNDIDGNGGYGAYVYYDNSEEADPEAEPGKLTVLGELSGGKGGEEGMDGVGLFLGAYDYNEGLEGIQVSLEDALAAAPEEIVDEIIAIMGSGDGVEGTMYHTLESAVQAVLYNGDLTEEELNAYEELFAAKLEEFEKEYENLDPEDVEAAQALEIEMMVLITEVYQQMLKEQASSTNLLELLGYEYPELELNKVSSVDSFVGVATAEEYVEENNTYVPSSTPKTGDSFNVVLVTTIGVLAILGLGATLVIRKKYC